MPSEPNQGIEFLYTRDCPAWNSALVNLQSALKELAVSTEIKIVAIDTLEQAALYRFLASPTIHFDGVDIERSARRTNRIGLGHARPYFYKGRSHSAPPVEMIVQELREYLAPTINHSNNATQ